ncbi:hypothetical protein [Endozoicomonas numazuensis]|uniref:PIN-like domain-containing protein n=1 Tax=Endozoicomonas numazuensis TaxID=1137799 RepID=A0A081NFH6_9GAMM|nr:hypothetical protein [Endozoicomonas numazuensis]KEQ17199.1 hypothetical protein GZ78_15275 [Endozoicomonas numazuensis]
MRFIFVDAENIGLKEVEPIEAAVSDKVFVFSKNEAIKSVCERKLFLYISSYPTGSNQADFYLIGNLVGIIASLTNGQKEVCEFVLYSRDNSLVTAFAFQCKLHKVKQKIALEPKEQKVIAPIKPEKTLDQKIFELLKTPMSSEAMRVKLKSPKPDFTRAMNTLIKSNKIQRSPKSQKNWVRA